jgi:hypothetical protein
VPKDPLEKAKFLAPKALRGLDRILVNQDGESSPSTYQRVPCVSTLLTREWPHRNALCVDELDTRDKVSQAIFENRKPLVAEQEVQYVTTTLAR